MPRIEWDNVGERFYETGVDRGVLHVYDKATREYSVSKAWNGLIGITNSPSGAEPTPMYADNIKYLNLLSTEEFGASIEAYTYPDEFARCDGSYVSNGVSVGQQSRDTFGLSYRTRIGNDVDADSHAYKIHLIWGALAAPTEQGYTTVNDSPEAITFNWSLTTTAIPFPSDGEYSNLKPMAYMSIDSRTASREDLKSLEDILYGSEETEGRLPLPHEVLELFAVEAPDSGGVQPASVMSGGAGIPTYANTNDTSVKTENGFAIPEPTVSVDETAEEGSK